MTQPKSITLLGATGSIGASVLSVMNDQPGQFRLEAVVTNSSVDELANIAVEQKAKTAVIADERHYQTLKEALSGTDIEVGAG